MTKQNPLSQSKSKILYESVEFVNPLEGLVNAEDVEEAFRVSYVDFQRDFMEELKELFFSNFEKQLSLIMSDIATIKQQQARLSVTSNIIDSLRKGDIQTSQICNNETSKYIKNIESMMSQLLSENKVLKDQLARVTCFLEMNSHDKPKTHRQLVSPTQISPAQILILKQLIALCFSQMIKLCRSNSGK